MPRTTEWGVRVERLGSVFAALLFACYALLVLLHRGPPQLGDFQNWIYSGVVLARHINGLPDTAHALKHYPVPNSTLVAMLAALSSVLSWQVAVRIYLLLHLAFCLWSTRVLAREVKAPGLIWYIVPSMAFLSIGLWDGFLAFQLGIALLFLFLAGLVRHLPAGRLPWGYSLLLVALFFTHMVPFTFACLLLIACAVQTRQLRAVWQAAPAAAFVVWYVVSRYSAGAVEPAGGPSAVHAVSVAAFLAYKVHTVCKSFGFVNPSATASSTSEALGFFGRGVFLALFVANLVVVASLCFGLVRSGAEALRRQGPTTFFWYAAIPALIVSFMLPDSLLGIVDPGARVFQAVVWPALLLFPARAVGRYRPSAVAAAASVPMALAGLVLFATLPWTGSTPPARAGLPRVFEAMAKVPYRENIGYTQALEQNRYDLQVFSTALLINLPSSSPATPLP